MYKNGTTNYNFPQWDALEHPDFLDDLNPAFKTIDTELSGSAKTGEEAAKQLEVLTPIVEGLNTSMVTATHDITDLQTRATNLEHDDVDHKNRIVSLEEHNKDIDATLYGFDESHPVSVTTDELRNLADAIVDQMAVTYDGEARPTNVKVGNAVVQRRSFTTTVLKSSITTSEFFTNLGTFSTSHILAISGIIDDGKTMRPLGHYDGKKYANVFYTEASGNLTCGLYNHEGDTTGSIIISVTVDYY